MVISFEKMKLYTNWIPAVKLYSRCTCIYGSIHKLTFRSTFREWTTYVCILLFATGRVKSEIQLNYKFNQRTSLSCHTFWKLFYIQHYNIAPNIIYIKNQNLSHMNAFQTINRIPINNRLMSFKILLADAIFRFLTF